MISTYGQRLHPGQLHRHHQQDDHPNQRQENSAHYQCQSLADRRHPQAGDHQSESKPHWLAIERLRTHRRCCRWVYQWVTIASIQTPRQGKEAHQPAEAGAKITNPAPIGPNHHPSPPADRQPGSCWPLAREAHRWLRWAELQITPTRRDHCSSSNSAAISARMGESIEAGLNHPTHPRDLMVLCHARDGGAAFKALIPRRSAP